MNEKQKKMLASLEIFRKENEEIHKRADERVTDELETFMKLEKDGQKLTWGSRSSRRRSISGQPRSRIFSEKMKIPRQR